MLGFVKAHIGRNMLTLVHPEDRQATANAFFERGPRPGPRPPRRLQVPRRPAANGGCSRSWPRTAWTTPPVGGVVMNARDVTERTNLTRALRTLAKSNQVLVNASDEASLLSGACHTIVEAGNYRSGLGGLRRARRSPDGAAGGLGGPVGLPGEARRQLGRRRARPRPHRAPPSVPGPSRSAPTSTATAPSPPGGRRPPSSASGRVAPCLCEVKGEVIGALRYLRRPNLTPSARPRSRC